MDSVYSIVHITNEENYKKIMKDGYLRPFCSVHGTGVFCFIQKKKDQWKKIINFKWFGNCAVELDKKILLERNDYIIRESVNMSPTWEIFGGPVVYYAKDDNDTNKLNRVIRNLTKLNEIMFEKKISLKKYMIKSM
jgi:hypothetical protein